MKRLAWRKDPHLLFLQAFCTCQRPVQKRLSEQYTPCTPAQFGYIHSSPHDAQGGTCVTLMAEAADVASLEEAGRDCSFRSAAVR